MTAEWWKNSGDTKEMLEGLPAKTPDRKLSLFGVACFRTIWHLLSETDRINVNATEQLAEVQAVNHGAYEYALDASNQSAIMATYGSWEALQAKFREIEGRTRAGDYEAAMPLLAPIEREEKRHCDILRHIISNPFRPYPAASWPSSVFKLADALYNGQDCGFALHDALLEAGHPELAEHFQKEAWHPKGCWVLDLILGKK